MLQLWGLEINVQGVVERSHEKVHPFNQIWQQTGEVQYLKGRPAMNKTWVTALIRQVYICTRVLLALVQLTEDNFSLSRPSV